MLGCKEQAGLKRSIGRNHQFDVGIGRNRTRPLHIQVGFSTRIVGAVRIVDAVNSWIVPVDDHLGRVGRKTKKAPERIYQPDVDIGLVDDRNRLLVAVYT